MFSGKYRSEVNEHTVKLIIGVIALSLAAIEYFLTDGSIKSISASYHYPYSDVPRNILIGFLFAIGALMLTYNGKKPDQKKQMFISKVGGISAFFIALFPCSCGSRPDDLVSKIHFGAAALLFIILAIFCYYFFKRAWDKPGRVPRMRAYIYAICGIAITLSIAAIPIDYLLGGAIRAKIPELAFWVEYVGLVSFAIAWLVASRHIKYITEEKERYWILGTNPRIVESD